MIGERGRTEAEQVTVIHTTKRTPHTYTVKNPARLTPEEARKILTHMGVQSAFVNGKYYQS